MHPPDGPQLSSVQASSSLQAPRSTTPQGIVELVDAGIETLVVVIELDVTGAAVLLVVVTVDVVLVDVLAVTVLVVVLVDVVLVVDEVLVELVLVVALVDVVLLVVEVLVVVLMLVDVVEVVVVVGATHSRLPSSSTTGSSWLWASATWALDTARMLAVPLTHDGPRSRSRSTTIGPSPGSITPPWRLTTTVLILLPPITSLDGQEKPSAVGVRPVHSLDTSPNSSGTSSSEKESPRTGTSFINEIATGMSVWPGLTSCLATVSTTDCAMAGRDPTDGRFMAQRTGRASRNAVPRARVRRPVMVIPRSLLQ